MMPRQRPRAAVIIPAHDEETVIGRCLATLLDAAEPGEFEVVVACNGCHDTTATIARHWGPDVRVLELPEASKPVALQAGDEAAHAFPRLYLDADVKLDSESARRLADSLSGTCPALAATPRMRVQLTDRPWTVRAFYQVWEFVPWRSEAPLGDGCYGLSEQGRARFARWPAIIADDLFANRLFAVDERRMVPEATFVVRPPRTLRDLVKVRTRVYTGNLQFAQAVRDGQLSDAPTVQKGQPVRVPLPRSPALWPCLAVYVTVIGLAKVRAHLRHWRADHTTWDRDERARTE